MNCERCGKFFTLKQSVITHLRNKNICEPIKSDISREDLINKLQDRHLNEKTYNCTICSKKFNTRQGKYNHEQKCKSESPPLTQIINNTNNYNNCNIINNPIINNPIINNNIVVLNGLGTETTPYLTEEVVKKLFLNKPEGLIEIFQLKHTNEDIPENHNLRKKVHKDKFIEAYNGSKWESKDKNIVCKEVFRNLGKDLLEFLNSNKDINFDEFSEEKKERLVHSFMDKIGIPLEWYMLFDTEVLKKYKDTYNVDWFKFEKKRNDIFSDITETVYQFTKP